MTHPLWFAELSYQPFQAVALKYSYQLSSTEYFSGKYAISLMTEIFIISKYGLIKNETEKYACVGTYLQIHVSSGKLKIMSWTPTLTYDWVIFVAYAFEYIINDENMCLRVIFYVRIRNVTGKWINLRLLKNSST